MIDKDYVYQLSRDDDFVEDINKIKVSEENREHIEAAVVAKDLKAGYRRWKKT